jgi:glycosyltransferase involved in cell wall biosynthesis
VQAEPEPRRSSLAVVVAARNEADRIGDALEALAGAFPGAAVWVADDASTDGTSEIALRHGARVVSRGRPHGKGANVTAACEAMLSAPDARELVLLCDADLGASAAARSNAPRARR